MSSESYYIGIDVGTGSARASLVKRDGSVVASSTHDTITYRDPNDHRIFEQSTNNIWSSISAAVKDCLAQSRISPSAVKGLGFDATCSLAVSDFQGNPVTVTKGAQLGQHGDRNIVLWADHRAEKEADLINSTKSPVLDYVGGTMSLEMEIPKILWLKNNMDPSLFSRCQFFDLPDFLTYRATSDITRSCCSLTCKCSYVPSSGWNAEFFESIGLGELVKGEYRQIGAGKGDLLTAGRPVGEGLSKTAAAELGLEEGTPVGSGLIDAYAGWLGTVAARYKEDGKLSDVVPSLEESQHRLAAVAGTSTCHLVQSPKGVFVPGVWGPYKDAVFQGWWMNEGGQSSTGQLIDFIVTTHPAYPQLVELGKEQQKNIHVVLQEILEKLRTDYKVETLTELTKDLHMYPDLHGNRSPIADPRMRGSFVGLQLDSGLHDLARKYNVTLEAIALQTRHIVDEMNARGHQITSIYMSGGQAKNLALMRLLANTCRMPVVLPYEHSGAVVLGAAMLGRFAADVRESVSGTEQNDLLWNIMVEMTPVGSLVAPSASAKERRLLEAKYKIFRETIEIQKRWRKEMDEASN
ncbi:putative FGGY family of carbohydrate kinases, C-terminal domain [Lyophyllum shimeji]|uniref:FGGY family of carbohydrate kinases, C-terminal domain n=1 Tax=Lyophyllum shimeji TaxID=47721 RepID=A0A9P3PC69_LYOSH|nr:putative FGGY family of carbohydrate kinases, C-terminal domain [Lyophyllum shimeji]